MARLPVVLIAAAAVLAPGIAPAQGYPEKAVRFVVPGPPGGATDELARMLGQKLNDAWKQPFVIDNRAGSNGTIGSAFVAKSAPDGYTIMMGHTGTHAINISLRKSLPYNPVTDFAPISLIAIAPDILVVHPSLPAHSVRDLIRLAKARPRELAYASSGVGGVQHLSGALFCSMAGIQMLHVPYKGTTPGLVDVIAGNVQVMFPNIPTALGHVKSGRLRALGVTSAKRLEIIPAIPTIAEQGLRGYEATVWFGVFAPAGIPAAVKTRLSDEIMKIAKQRDVQDHVRQMGADLVGNSPEEFEDFLKKEIAKWARVIKESGAKEQ